MGREYAFLWPALRPESVTTVSIYDQEGRKVYEWRFDNGAHALRGLPKASTIVARTSIGNSARELVERLRLADGQGAELAFDFAHHSRLSGTVATAGTPLEGFHVRAVPVDPAMPMAYAETTLGGRYDLWGLSPGRHFVRTRAGHSFAVDVAGHTSFDIELPPMSVSGVVRSARTMRPIGRAYVQLRRNGYRDGALTAPDGSFQIHGALAGEHAINVSRRGFEDLSQRLVIGGEESVTLEMEESAAREDGLDR